MQESKAKRVEVTVWKNTLIINDFDENGKAADRIIKMLPMDTEIEFNSFCG